MNLKKKYQREVKMKYIFSLLLLSQIWAFQNQNEQMMSPIVAYWKTLNQEEMLDSEIEFPLEKQ